MNVDEGFEDTKYLLSMQDPKQVFAVLNALNVCDSNETIESIDRAGEGNMNLVLRVTTDQRSVVVKQARPWVEKYPTIAAPDERILAEIDFYGRVSAVPSLAQKMPSVLAQHAPKRLLILEDLGAQGEATDYTSLYASDETGQGSQRVFSAAGAWLSQLHRLGDASGPNVGCDALRELNHAHIFTIPLSDPPAMELDHVCPGLEAASRTIRNDSTLCAAIQRLGEIYLHPGKHDAPDVLLHGDYYPGSWLKTTEGFRVIDPEFCFCGPPEFDLGIMAAHLIFCHASPHPSTIQQAVETYEGDASLPLVMGFAGVELIRRLIGVAQLPLDADLELRKCWLDLGRACVSMAQDHYGPSSNWIT